MAFIVLRRSRNTRSFYLVESYRDEQGKACRRTLCYLGREQDGTDTLAKALAHWQGATARSQKELRKARGERRQVIRRRIEATATRISIINEHIQLLARAEAERRKREQQAEEQVYWQSFEQLRRHPTQENSKAAKRAFLFLAKRHHPDQGGSHDSFLRVKDAYDRALAVWRRHRVSPSVIRTRLEQLSQFLKACLHVIPSRERPEAKHAALLLELDGKHGPQFCGREQRVAPGEAHLRWRHVAFSKYARLIRS